jgi:hypothetical protein
VIKRAKNNNIFQNEKNGFYIYGLLYLFLALFPVNTGCMYMYTDVKNNWSSRQLLPQPQPKLAYRCKNTVELFKRHSPQILFHFQKYHVSPDTIGFGNGIVYIAKRKVIASLYESIHFSQDKQN